MAAPLSRYLLLAPYFVVPLVMCFFMALIFLSLKWYAATLAVVGIFMVLPLTIAGTIIWWRFRPTTFDRRRGVYWRGWRAPMSAGAGGKDGGQLSDIHAIQVLHKFLRGLEINLVLKDGSRVYLMDNGPLSSRPRLAKDLKVLSEFLHVPLWNNAAPRQLQTPPRAMSPALQPA